MKLALFDLDHTVLDVNSDALWSHFLADKGLLDPEENHKKSSEFQAQYLAGTLDIVVSIEYVASFLSTQPMDTLIALRNEFVQTMIVPAIRPLAMACIEKHKQQGHEIILSSATNDFVVNGIIKVLNISAENVLCSRLGIENNAYTGKVIGTPNYQAGKVTNLNAWLADKPTLAESWGYSDSYNDEPLLAFTNHPHAVTPDDKLKAHAQAEGWEVLDWSL